MEQWCRYNMCTWNSDTVITLLCTCAKSASFGIAMVCELADK
jgi:hypothetical protein